MLCFKAIFAAVIASLFALVASQAQNNTDITCVAGAPQNLDTDDCFSALLEFTMNNNAIIFQESVNSHCVRSCQVILTQIGGSESEDQGIPRPEVQENLQVAINNCGRMALKSTFLSTGGVTASLELVDVTGRCIERP